AADEGWRHRAPESGFCADEQGREAVGHGFVWKSGSLWGRRTRSSQRSGQFAESVRGPADGATAAVGPCRYRAQKSRLGRRTPPHRPTTLADYLAILRRHWWVIAIPLVVAPIGAYLAASSQPSVYQATSTVYINRTPAVATATGVYDQSASSDPVRFFQTQADLARQPALLERAVRSANVSGVSAGDLSASSSVSPSSNADLLVFDVSNEKPDVAVALVNAYAREFTKYEPAQNVQQLTTALATVDGKLANLRSQGIKDGAVYSQLLERESELA